MAAVWSNIVTISSRDPHRPDEVNMASISKMDARERVGHAFNLGLAKTAFGVEPLLAPQGRAHRQKDRHTDRHTHRHTHRQTNEGRTDIGRLFIQKLVLVPLLTVCTQGRAHRQTNRQTNTRTNIHVTDNETMRDGKMLGDCTSWVQIRLILNHFKFFLGAQIFPELYYIIY